MATQYKHESSPHFPDAFQSLNPKREGIILISLIRWGHILQQTPRRADRAPQTLSSLESRLSSAHSPNVKVFCRRVRAIPSLNCQQSDSGCWPPGICRRPLSLLAFFPYHAVQRAPEGQWSRWTSVMVSMTVLPRCVERLPGLLWKAVSPATLFRRFKMHFSSMTANCLLCIYSGRAK